MADLVEPVRRHGRLGSRKFAEMLGSNTVGVVCAKNTDEASVGADVVIIEWNEFRALDFALLESLVAESVLVDLSNNYRPDDAVRHGFGYSSIERPAEDALGTNQGR